MLTIEKRRRRNMKFWLSVIIFMSVCSAHAAGLYDIAWESKVWRSSVPLNGPAEMVLTSSPTAVYAIHVQSSSIANASAVSIFNSSSTDDGTDLSTFTYATGWNYANSS